MPAVRFGIETALKDMESGGKQYLYNNHFTRGEGGIPINGLIWMNSAKVMLEQVKEKLAQGFRILKFKVGAINFEEEMSLLKSLRAMYSGEELEIRLDANGAWKPDEAIEKLKRLSDLDIHSLEQPIRAGQVQAMARVCEESPIDIALDEELIGIVEKEAKDALLQQIRPAYIILKPSLLGGIAASEDWIDAADSAGVAWWVTSALESNIGLNAIAQWTASLKVSMPQGLGTGMIYKNNISSPLYIKDAKLWHEQGRGWDFSQFQVDKGWI
jgi:o-succinylbenzoate synthase